MYRVSLQEAQTRAEEMEYRGEVRAGEHSSFGHRPALETISLGTIQLL